MSPQIDDKKSHMKKIRDWKPTNDHRESHFNRRNRKPTRFRGLQSCRERPISIEDKQRIIDGHDRRGDYYEMADVLGINRRPAYSIIRRYLLTGVVTRRRGGPNLRIVDDEMKDMLVSIVEDHPEYTIDQMNQELRLRLPEKRHVCNNTISNMLQCRLITLKLTRDSPAQWHTPTIKTQRRDMADWLLQNGDLEKIYIDESGFRLWIKRRGERAVRLVNGRPGGHMSVIFAVYPTWLVWCITNSSKEDLEVNVATTS